MKDKDWGQAVNKMELSLHLLCVGVCVYVCLQRVVCHLSLNPELSDRLDPALVLSIANNTSVK